MRDSFLPRPLLWLLVLVASAYSQHIAEDLSFGHKQPITGQGGIIPGWQASSSRHNLQILSDRAILTPPTPGNARGALWSDKTVNSETWTAEIEFRASGQDSGAGSNLQIWYARDKTPIFIDSAYTVENFDGLVLVIDQYGGQGGSIRGFLNDGTQNFRSHNNLESLAFGHCDYSYRNLGRPSKLKITNENGLTVSIDDRACFSTSVITLPSEYYFGVTAATSDQPDSFEVNKFLVSTGSPHMQQHSTPQEDADLQKIVLQKLDRFPGSPEAVPDKPADAIKSQKEQFADLHNRLQSLSHQMTNLFEEVSQLSQILNQHHKVMMYNVPSVVNDKLDKMGRRLENVERTLEGTNYKEHFESLGQVVSASAPRIWTFIFVVLGTQIMLAGAYVLYKRRRASMPKKYL